MRTHTGGLGFMADGAGIDGAVVPLDLVKLDRAVWLAAVGNGMRAVMAGFTVNPTLTGRHPVEGQILGDVLGGSRGVTGIAARFG